jgi:hypothetical protein
MITTTITTMITGTSMGLRPSMILCTTIMGTMRSMRAPMRMTMSTIIAMTITTMMNTPMTMTATAMTITDIRTVTTAMHMR